MQIFHFSESRCVHNKHSTAISNGKSKKWWRKYLRNISVAHTIVIWKRYIRHISFDCGNDTAIVCMLQFYSSLSNKEVMGTKQWEKTEREREKMRMTWIEMVVGLVSDTHGNLKSFIPSDFSSISSGQPVYFKLYFTVFSLPFWLT